MSTPKIGLQDIAFGQSGNDVLVNENMRRLDALHGGVIDRDLTTPPGSETDGDAYIVAATATGSWAGQEDDIAVYHSNAYIFITPWEGLQIWVQDEEVYYSYLSSAWTKSPDSATVVDQISDFTVGASHRSAIVTVDGGTDQIIITVDEDTTDANWPIGTSAVFSAEGAGGFTFTPGSGVTLQSLNGNVDASGQYAWVVLAKVDDFEFRLYGDLA